MTVLAIPCPTCGYPRTRYGDCPNKTRHASAPRCRTYLDHYWPMSGEGCLFCRAAPARLSADMRSMSDNDPRLGA